MTQDVLPPGALAHLQAGNKIEAIKELRRVTGLGLKEAKDWLDAYERGDAGPLPTPDYSARDPNASMTLSPRVVEALKRGNTIEAIKIVRETTGAGLLEAKTLVDEIQQRIPGGTGSGQKLAPGQVAGGMGPGKWLALLAVVAAVIAAVVFYR
jgi:ribosomal protein L7/L12